MAQPKPRIDPPISRAIASLHSAAVVFRGISRGVVGQPVTFSYLFPLVQVHVVYDGFDEQDFVEVPISDLLSLDGMFRTDFHRNFAAVTL